MVLNTQEDSYKIFLQIQLDYNYNINKRKTLSNTVLIISSRTWVLGSPKLMNHQSSREPIFVDFVIVQYLRIYIKVNMFLYSDISIFLYKQGCLRNYVLTNKLTLAIYNNQSPRNLNNFTVIQSSVVQESIVIYIMSHSVTE